MAELTIVKPTATPIETLVNDYLAAARSRGLSKKTTDSSYGAYGYPLKRVLLPFLTREGITQVDQLNNRVLERLSAELQDQGGKKGRPLSRYSIKSWLSVVNSFLLWAKAEGEKVVGKTPVVKTPKRVLDVLTRDEVKAMENTAQTERDKLIVRILADTGMRNGELVGLRVGDLIEQNHEYKLRVRGKGDKERLVSIPKLGLRIKRFIRSRRTDLATDRLFVGLRRRPGGEYERLTESGVQQVIRTLAQNAGITKRVYPHLLRHSFATWYLTQGGDSVMLMNLLGHTSLTMISRVYTHFSTSDEYRALAKLLTGEED